MKIAYALLVFVSLGVLSAVGYFTYRSVNKPSSKAALIVSPNDTAPKSTRSSDTTTLGVTDGADSQQSVPLTQKNQSNKNSSEKVLDPSQFSAYEEYKTRNDMFVQDINAGTGASVIAGKKVAVLYKGWLTNGTVFDESRPNENNQLQPFVFTPGAGEVIGGWEQGIIGMKVGGTRRLVLPPQAGYGSQGQGAIPPDSVLIFDIQLLEVEQ